MLTEALIRESLRAAKAALAENDGADESGDGEAAAATKPPRAGPAASPRARRQKPKPLLPAGVQTQFKQAKAGGAQASASRQPPPRPITEIGEATMAVSANRLELLQIADAVAREKSIDRADRPRLDGGRHAEGGALALRPGDRGARRDQSEAPARCAFRACCWSSTRSRTTRPTSRSPRRARTIRRRRSATGSPRRCRPSISAASPRSRPSRSSCRRCARPSATASIEEYKDRIGDIVNGVVKRVEYGNVIIDLGRGEAIIRRDEMIPREMFRPGDRVRAYVYDVRREQRGPQIFLSRTHPQFMAKLFQQEVPEIYDGVIEVKSVARDPGSRAKIAVISRDSSIDPVGACVGMRGSRVQAVVNELQGEKIDIIPWSPDAATFIVNALQPAEVVKVVLDEDSARIEVVVPDDQLSLAIGRRGQNVRLASQLTGWDIDILTEAEESERRQKEFVERTQYLHEGARRRRGRRPAAGLGRLPLGRGTGLRRTGRTRRDRGLRRGHRRGNPEPRAHDYLATIEAEQDARRKELGVSDELKEIDGVTTAMLVKFGENDVKTVEDLAGCATDDLIGWTERKDGETVKHAGFLDGLRADARGGRDDDHDGARACGLDRRRSRSRRSRRRWRRRCDIELDDEDRSAIGASAVADAGDDRSPTDAARAGPERTCIVTRTKGAPQDMIRFVLGPGDVVVPDIRRKLPGRGVWVTASADAGGRGGQEAALLRAVCRKRSSRPTDLRGRGRGAY